MPERFYNSHIAFETLISNGRRLRTLAEHLEHGKAYELDNASLSLKVRSEKLTVVQARLGSSALGGFGSLLGINQQLTELFPSGAMLALSSSLARANRATVALADRSNLAEFVMGVAHTNEPDSVMISTGTNSPTDQIATPAIMAAAASYVVELTEHVLQR